MGLTHNDAEWQDVGGGNQEEWVLWGSVAFSVTWRGGVAQWAWVPAAATPTAALSHTNAPHRAGVRRVEGDEVVGVRSFSLETCYLLFGRR